MQITKIEGSVSMLEKDNELLIKAIDYANKMHAGDTRKGTDMPYIVHPLEVMHNLYLMQASKTLMAAGVLHDVVEDTDATIGDIEKEFGSVVAELVNSHTEQHKEWPWEKRKITAMDEERNLPKDMQMLALADKLANIRAMHRDFKLLGEKLWERFNRGKDQQNWYYHSSVNVLKKLEEYPEVAPFYSEFKVLVDDVFGAEPEGCLK